jgi:tRNA threonylcarbamoyladenosine biosynthesis protein TsaB
MTLVGFDTSMPSTSACIIRRDGEAFCTAPPRADRLFEAPGHSEELLPELQRLLDESGTSWHDVESIAVGVGPGTFTGLRIGVSTARALGQALQVPLRPVSSLQALAAGLAAEARRQGVLAPIGRGGLAVGADRLLLPLIDARRGQVFAALYRRTEAQTDLALEPVWDPAVLDSEALLEAVRQLGEPPLCAGDWAIEWRAELEEAGAEIPASESGVHAVSAFHVCNLAASVDPVAPEDVNPVYLRLPDAEINRRLAERQD